MDLTLKVHEKGKNSIGLNGGVSGLEGAFVGLNYSTNNFLGLGETLQIQINLGNLARSAMFGFTQPYMFDRPLQFGFTVFGNKVSYNQARQLSIFGGQSLNLPNAVLQNLQNYSQSSVGFTTSLSYPLRRSFKRVGMTYSLDQSTLIPLSTASRSLFDYLAFQGITGPQAVNGIITSKIFPNFSFNTLDSGISPHKGHQMTLGVEMAGLGGTVRSIRPIVQYKRFIPVQNRRNAVGFNVQASYISGYGGPGRATLPALLYGRRKRPSWIRYSVDLAGGVPAQFQRDHAHQSGWDTGSQEPGQPTLGQLDNSHPGRPDCVSRRRFECFHEPGVPHNHRGTGGDRPFRRHRDRPSDPAVAIANCHGAI